MPALGISGTMEGVQGMMRGTMTAEEEKGTVPTMPISPTGELSRLTW